MIEFRDVHRSFGNLEVLKRISLNIEKDQVVTLTGPSRSGKSTILRCINLLEKPTKGQMFIDSTDITVSKADIQAVRKNIGMVSQHFSLFPHMTVMENMTYVPMKVNKTPKDKAAESALEFLKLVGPVERADAYPGKPSGGQKQRIAIARALAMKSQTMLFDGPTSALNPEMVKEALEIIKNLAHIGITMTLVTHEMGFIREVSDHIRFTNDGQIVEDVNPNGFFKSPKSDRARGFLEKMLQRKYGQGRSKS